MWLGRAGKTIGSMGIKHPLGGDRFPVMSAADLESLVRSLRDGDDSVKEAIFLAHVKLAINIAGRYVRQAKNKDHDLVSEAFLAITYALAKAREKLHDNDITPWIVSNIHRYVHAYILKDHAVAIPQKTMQEHAEKGLSLALPLVGPLHMVDEAHVRRNTRSNVQDILELLDLAINSEPSEYKRELKRTVMQLRSAGYNDREVSEILHISNAYVNTLRREVAEKYIKLAGE